MVSTGVEYISFRTKYRVQYSRIAILAGPGYLPAYIGTVIEIYSRLATLVHKQYFRGNRLNRVIGDVISIIHP
jgi:hypothetical protein